MEAAQAAPQALRYNATAHTLVRQILNRQRRTRTNTLHQLAVRAEVLES